MSRRQYGTLQPVCSPGEPWGRLAGGGIAVASIDNSRCPSQKCLAKLCKRLALLFPQPGVFSGYTTVVSVIWQLSSALKGTFIKEIQYILLAPLHFLDQSAKGGMFPVSHFFSPPFFHISRCYWGSISTPLHMVKHVPESWHNVKKKKKGMLQKVSGTVNTVEHHWPPLGWDTHCRSPELGHWYLADELGTRSDQRLPALKSIKKVLQQVSCPGREGGQLLLRVHADLCF